MKTRSSALLVALLAACCLWIMLPAGALAAEIRSGPAAGVAPGETVDDDLFTGGSQTVTISGHVTGDAYAAGETVYVNGSIDGDLIAVAQQVIVDGSVGGNVRAAGASVTINGTVGRNMTAAGQHVSVTSNGRVGGSLLAAAQTIDAFGQIGRGVTVGGGTLQIDGQVGGPVLARIQTLTVAPTAHLASSLDYQAPDEAAVPAGTVTGAVNFTPTPRQAPAPEPVLNGLFDLGGLAMLVGSFLVGALAIVLLPRPAARAAELGRQHPWQSFGVGLVVFLCLPIAALVVGITIVGIPLALCMIALYVVAMFLAWPAAALVLGLKLSQLVRPQQPLPVLGSLAIGMIVLHLVTHVPFVGPLVAFCALVFGLGVLAQMLRRTQRQAVDQPRATEPLAAAA